MDIPEIWSALIWPLLKLTMFISLGLLFGQLIEALNWTKTVAAGVSPLLRLGRLSDIAGASFSLAFFSGISANSMLADAYEQGRISRRELIMSNLFNSLPTYFLHLPSVFFILAPLIGTAAVVYLGLTIGSALLRTLFILLFSRFFLPPPKERCVSCRLDEKGPVTFRDAVKRTIQRFKKRIVRVLSITVPIYVGFFLLNRWGAFTAMEGFMAQNLSWLSWLSPQAVGVVIFQMAAEFSAGAAAAGALLAAGSLGQKEVVLALLVGNILSSPMRAIRHQFPYYAGIFKPALAAKLIFWNQGLRVLSLLFVGAVYSIAF
ncbi:membrane protein [Desulfonatronum thioautotrophicum]|uniref:membrane protein n=1 Tax=Desulfonatronum thioautotrophicum TaxID=617001 RepID=UPI0005EBF0F8|nr:membrane protein [Desulfonatronum thioautotrophicum]